MQKTIIVTGAAGFIGSNFVELAGAQGYHTIVLDALTYAGHRENLESVHKSYWELVEGNINDENLVRNLYEKYRPEAFLNFAAESHVDRSILGPGEFIHTNIIGSYTLLRCALEYFEKLDAAKKAAFRYLQVSTDEVYGSLGATGKFSETTAMAPNSPYSASKAAADLLTRAWFHTYGLPTITTNCSNNYGPKQYPEKLIPHMIDCALKSKALPVYGDGGNIRDWIHVKDHCAGILLALQKGRPGETYCFGGDAERNNLDVVKQICQHLDKLKPRTDGKFHAASIGFVTDRLGHDKRYAIDDSKAQKELGFKREFKFDSGLADTVKWYLDNEAWSKSVMNRAAR